MTYVHTSAKLDACGQRWVAQLANYNLTTRCRCGQSNVEADALSRISWPEVLSDEDTDIDLECMDTHVVNAVLTGTNSKSGLIESVSCSSKIIPEELDVENNCTTILDWVKLQRTDPNLSVIIKLIESDQFFKRKLHRKDSPEVKILLRIRKSLKLSKDILYRKSYTDNSSSIKVLCQLVVPKAYRPRALAGCHDDVGHQGRMRTISLLREISLARLAGRSYPVCGKMLWVPLKKNYSLSSSPSAHICNSAIRVGSYGLFVFRTIQRQY